VTAVLEVAAGAGIDHQRIVEVVTEPGSGRPPGAGPGAGR
jgi:hypothetical protein